MQKGLLFWILMILWFIFGLYLSWPVGPPFGTTVLLFVLLALLGWQVFGKPIQ